MVFAVLNSLLCLTLFTFVVVDDGLDYIYRNADADNAETSKRKLMSGFTIAMTVVASMLGTSLIEEIFVGVGSEVRLRARLAADEFTGTDQLQVVKTAGDTVIAVGVKGIQSDVGPAVHTGLDLGAGKHGVEVRVHDAGCISRVCVDEIGVSVEVGSSRYSASPSRRGVLIKARGSALLELPLSLDSPSA